MNMASSPTILWQARLQKSVGYLRMIFLVSAITFGVVGAISFAVARRHPPFTFYSDFKTLTDAVECWLAYNLFCYYERGNWFAPQAVRWMQAFGVFSLLRGSIFMWQNFQHLFHLQNTSFVVRSMYYVPFVLSQLLHNLVFGCVILFIAWILDQGRKIQEEQALTV
jgi:hypothetical protein